MSNLSQAEWLAQISEEIIDPEQRIIDPHHHLWPSSSGGNQYLLDDLWADTGSGHNVTNTVFIDCSQCYWNLEDAALNPSRGDGICQRIGRCFQSRSKPSNHFRNRWTCRYVVGF